MISKVISKILADRVKPIMSKLVTSNQASLIPDRHASDNIVIIQEAIHSIKRKTRKNGAMVVNMDLEKAYDRIQ